MEYEPLSHPLSLKFMSGATGVDMSRKSQVENFLHSATEVQSKITSIGKVPIFSLLSCMEVEIFQICVHFDISMALQTTAQRE